MNYFLRGSTSPYNYGAKNFRCPACRQIGSFSQIPQIADLGWINPNGTGNRVAAFRAGMRMCPNTDCRALLFFVEGPGSERISFPPEVMDFDASNLPKNILSSLEEAIKCHAAECYRASALLVRRTLEELCDDKGLSGGNLKTKIGSLNSVAVIPTELLAAADELRILGNDAAHIEAKDYDKIGKEESELAIELAKELLKAVYQYTSLVARLTALKKTKSP
ncbi:DUF4145 domain-containing protein [Labrys sp. KB_33_2]|uniref:DUF4145 domain-containing protein n=1 Tax=Labrys sp. KB_33_2 TaxID=3237479 RepID=UPI003F904638